MTQYATLYHYNTSFGQKRPENNQNCFEFFVDHKYNPQSLLAYAYMPIFSVFVLTNYLTLI